MKQYLIKNILSIILGISIGLLLMVFKEAAEDIILKIAILKTH